MIQKFVDKFMANKTALEEIFAKKHPDSYEDIVEAVITVISKNENEYNVPDPERIHVIDDGDYQGILLFVIASGGYQPDEYWSVMVFYGSCSGCDTLKGIRGYNDEKPTKEQVKDYMTLALHIVQGLTPIGGDFR